MTTALIAGDDPVSRPTAQAGTRNRPSTGTGTSTSTGTGTGTALRRRPYLAPVPNCEPPFDDERSPVSRLQQLRPATRAGASLLAFPIGRTGFETPGRVGTGPDVIGDKAVPGWSQDDDIGVRRTATAQLPATDRSGPFLARALIEVLSGQRPSAQLRVHCAPDVFAGLQARPVVKGALGHLLSIKVCEPADGVAEVSAVFRRAGRVRALAFRIQGVDGRWRITALETG